MRKTFKDVTGISEKKVQCNLCMAIFEEGEIIIKNDEEYCPNCNTSGYLMDI